ncbi:hypothetical protein CbuD7D7780_00115 [Coxiella burnetii]|uniref:Uncharacterized protein n=1 Tax=Coxiella burnetii (strain Dugway 5J108-111) TaxID=434922 RepID=A9KEX4_COXBN|nr:hypothetical protein [Coxiella burnetii]ABS77411.2 hypothetical protein CBUD_0030 [Coxiella burnetii Dugway 5J108-111]OYK81094.1 hypothetical protein CbuD7E6568_00115 [Coxiella burnetii]OYK83185.1 hypothetical protein CbuD7D7780_00115 [Coxiella burnetii]
MWVMTIKKLLEKIDQMICSYLGLGQEETRPAQVQMTDGRLIISNTTAYKRHVMKESWSSFSDVSLKRVNPESLEKLGLAAEKAIAKNLIISFEKPTIK